MKKLHSYTANKDESSFVDSYDENEYNDSKELTVTPPLKPVTPTERVPLKSTNDRGLADSSSLKTSFIFCSDLMLVNQLLHPHLNRDWIFCNH